MLIKVSRYTYHMSTKEKKPEKQDARSDKTMSKDTKHNESQYDHLLDALAELRSLIAIEDSPTHTHKKRSRMNMVSENEILLEDLKTIESYSELLLEALTVINRRAKQARQQIEIQMLDTKQSLIKPEPLKTEPLNYYRNEHGGPWSNALRKKYMKALKEKHGIKMREGYE